MTQAVAQQGGAAPPPDLQAKFQQAAQKTCDDDLDRGRFGDYGSMEDCVSDKTQKLVRVYRANPAAAQAAVEQQARRPN
jgi:hypothetical protein